MGTLPKSITVTLPANTTPTGRFVVDVGDYDIVTVYSNLNNLTGYMEITDGQYVGQELILRNVNRGAGSLVFTGSRGLWYGVWNPSLMFSYANLTNGFTGQNGNSTTSKQDGSLNNPWVATALLKWVGDYWFYTGGMGVSNTL